MALRRTSVVAGLPVDVSKGRNASTLPLPATLSATGVTSGFAVAVTVGTGRQAPGQRRLNASLSQPLGDGAPNVHAQPIDEQDDGARVYDKRARSRRLTSGLVGDAESSRERVHPWTVESGGAAHKVFARLTRRDGLDQSGVDTPPSSAYELASPAKSSPGRVVSVALARRARGSRAMASGASPSRAQSVSRRARWRSSRATTFAAASRGERVGNAPKSCANIFSASALSCGFRTGSPSFRPRSRLALLLCRCFADALANWSKLTWSVGQTVPGATPCSGPAYQALDGGLQRTLFVDINAVLPPV